MKKKVYVLTWCGTDNGFMAKNYVPYVFATKEKAIERMSELYKETIELTDADEENCLFDNMYASVYTDDGGDVWEIFTVEVDL